MGFFVVYFVPEPVKQPVKPERRKVVAREKSEVKGVACGLPEIKGGLLVSKWFQNNCQATQFNVYRIFLWQYVDTHFSSSL